MMRRGYVHGHSTRRMVLFVSRAGTEDCCRCRSRKSRNSLLILLVRVGLCGLVFLSVKSPVGATDDGNLVENGRAIVEQKCARCHAIGATGESPHPKALPFRFIVKRYPVEDLAEALAEGIVSGHPDMPVFAFEPAQINAILAYIDSLGQPAHDK